MKTLQLLRNHPILLALSLAVVFGGWLAYEATRPPGYLPADPPRPPLPQVSVQMVSEDATIPSSRSRDTLRPGIVTPELITRLKPGMARVDVEELIGMPPARLVHPVANVDGRLTYRATYLANLEPMQKLPPGSAATPPARSTIGLEFDASRPGHPLLKVLIPDPMS